MPGKTITVMGIPTYRKHNPNHPNVTYVVRSTITIQRLLPWPACHLFTDFRNKRLSSFCVIPLTNKQTNKQTYANENITLAEAKINKVRTRDFVCS